MPAWNRHKRRSSYDHCDTSGRGKKSICVSFGRAPYFLIHDTDSAKTEMVENPAAEAQGGAGIKAAQLVVDKGANALITVRCGQNAADVFKAAEIKIYKAFGSDAAENLKALAEESSKS